MKSGSYIGLLQGHDVTVNWEFHPRRKIITYVVTPHGFDDYVSYDQKPERAERFLKAHLATRHGVEPKGASNGTK